MNKVIVVFDGYNTDEPSESKYIIQNIEVIYSKKDEKADEVIVRIARRCGNAIVVTNDNEIKKNVESSGCSCISPDEFKALAENIINGSEIEVLGEYGESEEPAKNYGKKGNPHKLSKKERLKLKKIKKI